MGASKELCFRYGNYDGADWEPVNIKVPHQWVGYEEDSTPGTLWRCQYIGDW